MTKKIFDVIIVGAGPSGAQCARLLGKQNINVLIIDKFKLPRIKPCAGGLPCHLEKEIDFDISPVINNRVVQTKFTYKYERPVLLKSDNIEIKLVDRDKFDFFLVEQALQENVELIDNCKLISIENNKKNITAITSKGKFYTKLLIGADGPYSKTANLCGLLKKRVCGWAVNAEVFVSAKQLENQINTISIEMGSIPKGYGWVFPKNNRLSCGVGVFMYKIPALKNMLFEYLNSEPNTKNYKDIKIQGHPLSISYKNKLKINTKNILLIGDAAALVDGLSGEGIYYAFLSAKYAANAVLEYFNNNVSLNNYSKTINKKIRKELEYSNKFANIYYKFPELVYKHGVSNPVVNQKFQKLLIGATTYKEMYKDLKKEFGNLFKKKVKRIFFK